MDFSLIDFERVSLKYSEKNYILKDVYFSVKPGGFICVDGKASSGKTSLVKLIGLLKSPTSGRIRLFGRNVSKLNRNDLSHLHKRIGIVYVLPVSKIVSSDTALGLTPLSNFHLSPRR